jgi:hypothetical protein
LKHFRVFVNEFELIPADQFEPLKDVIQPVLQGK